MENKTTVDEKVYAENDIKAKASNKNWMAKLFQFVPREDWGAVPPSTDITPLKVPVSCVVVTWTETEACHTADECEERLRGVQKADLSRGLSDIQYNDCGFHLLRKLIQQCQSQSTGMLEKGVLKVPNDLLLVVNNALTAGIQITDGNVFALGSDGRLYEGRGWTNEAPLYLNTLNNADKLNGNCIEVAYIERSENEVISDSLQKALSYLFSMGITEHKLSEKFDVYCKTNNEIEFISSHDNSRTVEHENNMGEMPRKKNATNQMRKKGQNIQRRKYFND